MSAKLNIIKALSQSPDSAWQMMESSGISILDLLEEPAHKLNQQGLHRLAELTAQKIHGANTNNGQVLYQELCAIIDDHFGVRSSHNQPKNKSNATPKSKAQLLQDLYNQTQQANNNRQSSASNPFPNTQPSVLMQGGVNAVKNVSRHLKAPTAKGAKIATRFLMVHPDYLKQQFWHDLAHHIGSTMILMIAASFFGLVFSAFASSVFLIKGWLSAFVYMKYVFAYVGMVNAWNFYLYKHRGYRWS